MKKNNFRQELNNLINKVQKESDIVKGVNASYLYILSSLSKIESEKDLKNEADRLLYFIADSYSGLPEIENELGIFLNPYKNKKGTNRK